MYRQNESNGLTQQPSFLTEGNTFVMERSTQTDLADEVLVADGRANLGPAAQVENKVSHLLRGNSLMLSRVRTTALFGSRRSC